MLFSLKSIPLWLFVIDRECDIIVRLRSSHCHAPYLLVRYQSRSEKNEARFHQKAFNVTILNYTFYCLSFPSDRENCAEILVASSNHFKTDKIIHSPIQN